MQIWSLGQEEPLKKGMATHSSILSWWIPMDRGTWQVIVHRVTQLKWLSMNPLYVCVSISIYVYIDCFCCSVIQLYTSLCDPRDCSTPARQTSLSLTISQSLPKFMSIASVMPSSHLILWCPLLLLPSIFRTIGDFSNEVSIHIRWPKYRSLASALVLPVNIHHWSPLRLTSLLSLLSKGLSRVFSSTTVWRHQFAGVRDHWEDHRDTWQSNVSAFQHTVYVCHRFPAKKRSSDFMAAVAIRSDFGAQEDEICHYFPFYLPCSNMCVCVCVYVYV